MEKSRPILMRAGSARDALGDPEGIARSLLAAAGAVVALVGLVDLGLLWLPLEIGTAAWEFGTVSETVDALPTTGLGVALVAYVIVKDPSARRSVARSGAIASGLVALMLVLLGLLYARAVPTILTETPDHLLETVRGSVLQTTTRIVGYVAGSLIVAGLLWRGSASR